MKQIKIILTSLTILLTINCCSPNKEKNDLSTNKIIFLTDVYETYLTHEGKNANKETLANKLKDIHEGLFDQYFSKCEYAELLKEESSDSLYALIDPTKYLKIIQGVNSNKKIITERINTVLSKCNEYLPYEGVNIFISVDFGNDTTFYKKFDGIGGVTAGSHQIAITINPSVKGWEDNLEITIAHEFHHAYWTKFNLESSNPAFLHRIIFEGKAEVFSHLLYPDIKQPWDNTLTETQKKELWTKIKPHLNSTDFSLQDNIMFGYNGYPFCSGYILGRDIVSAALKKDPHIEVKNWTNFSPEYILKTSGY